MSEKKSEKKWDANLKKVLCPKCATPQPRLRIPKTFDQAFHGGWTCPKCGTKIDRFGNLVESEQL